MGSFLLSINGLAALVDSKHLAALYYTLCTVLPNIQICVYVNTKKRSGKHIFFSTVLITGRHPTNGHNIATFSLLIHLH